VEAEEVEEEAEYPWEVEAVEEVVEVEVEAEEVPLEDPHMPTEN